MNGAGGRPWALFKAWKRACIQHASAAGLASASSIAQPLAHYPDLQKFIEQLGRTGLGLGDFETNGMFLPSEERTAHHMHLPLHRGPHLTYDAVMVDALDGLHQQVIRHRVGLHGQQTAVRGLQRRLKMPLQLSALDTDVALGGRDPFGPIPVAAALDRQTDALFAATLQVEQCQAASA